MSESDTHPDLAPLAPVLHRRWAGPIVAALADPATARAGGARVAALAARLGIARHTARATIAELRRLGLVAPDTDHGHPLRPEVALTRAGRDLGPGFIELDRRLAELELRDIGYRKWSLPTLGAIGGGPARFSDIASSVGSATDRAVSLALSDLLSVELIERDIVNAAPPRPVYAPTRAGEPLMRTTRQLAEQIALVS